MSFHHDPDLESRLRRIAAGPEPDMPASIYRQLNEVVAGNRARSINGVRLERVRLRGRGRPSLRQAGAIAALAAVVVIAVSASALLVATRGPQAASTWTLRPDAGQGEWTGLEWHDITATASGLAPADAGRMGGGTGTGGVVQWRGGFAALGADVALWLSQDGLTWKRAEGAPRWPTIAVLGGDLLVAGQVDSSDVGLSITADGVSWSSVQMPSGLMPLSGLVSGDPGVVALSTAPDVGQLPGPSVVYFTTDAKTWTRASLPTDLAQARGLSISPFIDGFIALGLVSDPNGTTAHSENGGPEERYSNKAWISPDGLTWAAYDPATPVGQGSEPTSWYAMQNGRLGAGDGRVYSTDGGVTWLADHNLVLRWPTANHVLGGESVSDGNRIIMAAGSGMSFYLSEGDGHWHLLQQGGDVGSLPAEGAMMLLPDGMLWVSHDRVYFGQALSGVEPQGSLGPPTTPTPPASVWPTPAVSIVPTTLPTPEPLSTVASGPTMTAAGFTTPGVTTGWSDFTWVDIDAGGALGSVRSVQAWSGGYFATTSTDPSGPTTGLWISKDAVSWTPVTSVGAGTVFVAAAPGGLVAVAVGNEAPYKPGSVWTSSDGTSWHDAGWTDLPAKGSLVSLAGTGAGIVATVDLGDASSALGGSYSVLFSQDGIHWGAENGTGGILATDYMQTPHVQSGNGRFFLTGMNAPIPVARSMHPASSPRFVLDATSPLDVTFWSDDGVTWTECGGSYSGFAGSVLFGRSGLLLETNYKSTPGGVGLARSSDGGKTWIPDDNFNPLGVADTKNRAGSVAPAGVIVSNGTAFLAISDGAKAAISYDGQFWMPVSWGGPAAQNFGMGSGTGFVMLPRGVVVAGQYGEAH